MVMPSEGAKITTLPSSVVLDALVEDDVVEEIDMELDKDDAPAKHFESDEETNIWDNPQPEEEDEDMPSFLRRRKKKES